MAQVYSPTPHRVSLCALARYLVHSHARDTAAAERMGVSPEEVMWWLDRPSRRRVDVTTGEPLGPVLLGPADARRLAAVLMYEASRSDGFREPDLRTFTASLSTHHVAVRPYHDEDELDDELDDPMAAHVDHPDELTEVIHETFADLLRDAVNSIHGVDSIARLFHEVAPRSKHESEMRGLNDDDPEREYQPDPFPEGPGAAEEGSALGVFLRRCVADFERLTFEGSVSVFGRFASYVAEGAGVYDDLDQAKMRDETDAASNRLRVDQRQADAEVIGRVDDSDDDDDNSHRTPPSPRIR
jgi:anaphase-promoting complex subunit 5